MTNLIGRKVDGFFVGTFPSGYIISCFVFFCKCVSGLEDAGRHTMEHRPLAVGPPRSVGGRPLLEEKWVSSPSAFFYFWGGSV